MIQCPHCASSVQQTKAGHTHTGSQRHKCRGCRRIHTPGPKPLGYPEQTRRQAARLYLGGVNFRRTGRIPSVNHQSAVNRVNSDHASLPAAARSVTAPQVVEPDGLFTSVGSKERKPTSSRP